MKIVPNSTDWLAMVRRIRRNTEHAKRQKFVAASIDIADLERLLAVLDDSTDSTS